MVFSNSSVTLVHGMSRPIDAHFHIADGISNAMLLAKITNFSIRSSEGRYAECDSPQGGAKSTESKSETCQKLVMNLQRLQGQLIVPSPEKLGFCKTSYFKNLPIMAKQALTLGHLKITHVCHLSNK